MLKATVGANEVISTIMLNYIALYLGAFLFGLGGPLQNPKQPSVPVSSDVASSAKLPVFWGDPELQGLHVGLFIAIAALVVFWVILNRSTTGYEVRAVGLNPEAARYGGMSVGQELHPGHGASAASSPGWRARWTCSAGSSASPRTTCTPFLGVGFLGIAVALLGRNTAIGDAPRPRCCSARW